jgi:hypothetical protein
MTRPKPVKKTKGRWPEKVREEALRLVAETKSPAETRRRLEQMFRFEGGPPDARTIRDWRRASSPRQEPEKKVQEMVEARREQMTKKREELSDLLIGRLSRPAAETIAKRLVEAEQYEDLVARASQRFLDALKAEEVARADFGEEELASARKATRQARLELSTVLELRIDVRDLVGVVTRGIADHLALEGIELEGKEVGDLIVELLVPRPDPRKADRKAVPQAELAKRLGKKGKK